MVVSRNTANVYDALNRVSQVTDPNNGITVVVIPTTPQQEQLIHDAMSSSIRKPYFLGLHDCSTSVLDALNGAGVAVAQTLQALSGDAPLILTPAALLNIVSQIPGDISIKSKIHGSDFAGVCHRCVPPLIMQRSL